MAIDIDRYNKLRRQSEEARSAADQAKGKLDGELKTLNDEFGAKTIEEAETLLQDLVRQEQAAEDSYNAALERFEEAWKGKL